MQQKLYRSRTHRVIAGVCGGLGEYFDIDPVIVRALFVVAAFGGGFGILTYIILWIVIPDAQGAGAEALKPAKETKEEAQGRRNLGAIVLIVLGALFLFNNFVPHWNLSRMWPLLLIFVGLVLLARRS